MDPQEDTFDIAEHRRVFEEMFAQLIEDEACLLDAFSYDAIPQNEARLHINYLRLALLQYRRGNDIQKEFGEYILDRALTYMEDCAESRV